MKNERPASSYKGPRNLDATGLNGISGSVWAVCVVLALIVGFSVGFHKGGGGQESRSNEL
jgi:hypothetical protein